MNWLTSPSLELFLAYLLDQGLGDPQRWPHPVRIIGRGITTMEEILWHQGREGLWRGVLLWFLIVSLTYGGSWLLIHLARHLSTLGDMVLSSVILYWCLAVKDLALEARRVERALKEGDMERARRELALIVGRDTQRLDQGGMIRATVETVAENITDGIISPIFYAVMGGPPLAMAYKAVNTLDSMLGYKNQRYRYFGYFSAKADDLANYIPARLAMVLITVACVILRKNPRRAMMTAIREGRKHPSPNAGLTEATMAGALGFRLGGPSHYQGQLVYKPFIGEELNPPAPEYIEEAIAIMQLTALLGILMGCLILNFL